MKIKFNLNVGQVKIDTDHIPGEMMDTYNHYESNIPIFKNMIETVWLKRKMNNAEYTALENILVALHGHKYVEIFTVIEMLYMFINHKEEMH